jgi:hypothetical protein
MHPIEKKLSYENVTKEYKAYLTSIGKENEPNNFEEALSKPVWCNAMRDELMALEKNQTWVVVPLPNRKKPVVCK